MLPQNFDFETQPSDWNRWGPHDEIGRANLLSPQQVLQAAACIKTGRRYSLALPINAPGGDPVLGDRPPTEHRMLRAASDYASGRIPEAPGGMRSSDDWIGIACHGTTHLDALGHAYAGDALWNGYGPNSEGGLVRADIAALAAKGIVGRAVLVDIPRHRSSARVNRGERIAFAEVIDALAAQRTVIRPGDTILIRTGTAPFFERDRHSDGQWHEDEPGLSYERELIDFVVGNDIAGFGTDTLCNEQPHSETLGIDYPLHVLLQRNLGVLFHEALWLEDWALDCAGDGVYEAFYVAAPLRIVGGTGGPMNPIVIK